MKSIAQVKAFIKKGAEAFVKKWHAKRSRELMRHAYNARGYIRGLHFTRLQAHFALPLIGEDERKDKRLWAALYRFFECNYETQEEPEENGGNEFYEWLLENDQAAADREKYYLLSYWETSDASISCKIAKQYWACYKKEIIPLDAKSIKKLHSTYKKRCRREVREFRESKAQRIRLDLESLAPLLKWASLCFVVGGYAYANILYGKFGLPLGQFFSIGDYLALSLEQIQSLMLAIAGYIIGGIYGYRNQTTVTKFEAVREQKMIRISDGMFILSSLSILIGHITGWTGDMTSGAERVFPPFLLTIAVFWIANYLVIFTARRYFENALQAGFVFLFVIVFGANLYFNAEHKIEEIEAGRSETSFRIVVQSNIFTENNSVFVGSNSRYLFLKTAQDKVEAFRLNQIDRISFQKELN